MVANITNFNLGTDVKVQLLTPPAGAFILGQSLLGGTDVLSDGESTWENVSTEGVTGISWSRGMGLDGAIRVIEAGTCQLSFLTQTFDPWVDPNVRVGAQMRIVLEREPEGTTYTNFVPNPSFEQGVAWGWTSTGAVITQVNTEAYSGTDSLRVACSAVDQSSYNDPAYRPTVYPSTAFIGSMWVKGEAGKSVALEITDYTAGGAALTTTTGATTVLTGAWQRITLSKTMGATASTARLLIRNKTAGAHTFYIDAIMLTEGTNLLDYFDGDGQVYNDEGLAIWFYDWTDVPSQSASYKRAIATTLFTGKIDSLAMSYDKEGWASVNVSLVDATQEALNYRIPEYVTDTGVNPYDLASNVIFAMTAPAGLVPNPFNNEGETAHLGPYDTGASAEVIAGDLINQAIEAEQGWFWVATDNLEYVYLGRGFTGYTPVLTIGNNEPESDIYFPIREIDVDLSTTHIINAVNVTSSYDPGLTQVSSRNQDSIDLYGFQSQDYSPYLYDSAELTSWAANLPLATVSRRVNSVTVSAITAANALNEVATLPLADSVTLDFSRSGFTINGSYMIRRMTHTLTFEEWLTTFELWKGNN